MRCVAASIAARNSPAVDQPSEDVPPATAPPETTEPTNAPSESIAVMQAIARPTVVPAAALNARRVRTPLADQLPAFQSSVPVAATGRVCRTLRPPG